jgi:hypothetical protein
MFRSIGFALFNCGHLRLLLERKEREDDQHDRQHSQPYQRNSEPVNFPHRENLAFDKPWDSLYCTHQPHAAMRVEPVCTLLIF